MSADINAHATLSATYEAEQLAKALHLVFWLREQAPGAAAYHLADARSHFEKLAAHIENLDGLPPLDDEQPLEVTP